MSTGIQIGPLFIHWYGLIIMIGALVGAWLSTRLAPRHGQDPELVWDMLPWLLLGGIIGARLWHVLTPPASMVAQGLTTRYYFTHPLEILAIWNGGLGIPGAVMGGVLALWLYLRKRGLPLLPWLDTISPGLAIAQAIGRWGNYVNQELYGAPTDLPWKLFIDEAHRLPEYRDVAYYHPLFLYEFIWNAIVCLMLVWVGGKFRQQLKPGTIFLLYLILYPGARFLLEFIRLDPSNLAALNANQTLMAVIALSSAAVLIYQYLIKKERKPTTDA